MVEMKLRNHGVDGDEKPTSSMWYLLCLSVSF